MTTTDIIGSIGVATLLIAYFMNLFNIINRNSYIFIWMNIIGALIACYASFLLDYIPFVILEGVWSAVSIAALVKKYFYPSISADE